MSRQVPFYFDYVSPYAYLAWQALPEFIQRYQIEVLPQPILLGGLLRSLDSLGPAEIPAKRQWVYQDVCRIARLRGLELNFPPAHPFRSLLAMRVTCAVAREFPERLHEVVSSFFAAAWRQGRDLSQWETLSQILNELRVPLSEAECITPEVKQDLMQRTEHAMQSGIFGVPTVIVHQEVFWGHDRLEQAMYCLSEGDVLSESDKRALLTIPEGV